MRPPGTFDITVTAFQACTGACECDGPNPDLACTLTDAAELAEPLTLSVPLAYPETAQIDVPIGG